MRLGSDVDVDRGRERDSFVYIHKILHCIMKGHSYSNIYSIKRCARHISLSLQREPTVDLLISRKIRHNARRALLRVLPPGTNLHNESIKSIQPIL